MLTARLSHPNLLGAANPNMASLPPWGGSLRVEPSVGTELSTAFGADLSGWMADVEMGKLGVHFNATGCVT